MKVKFIVELNSKSGNGNGSYVFVTLSPTVLPANVPVNPRKVMLLHTAAVVAIVTVALVVEFSSKITSSPDVGKPAGPPVPPDPKYQFAVVDQLSFEFAALYQYLTAI